MGFYGGFSPEVNNATKESVALKFSTATTATAASGYMQFNATDPTAVTLLYVSRYNLNGDDINVYLDEDISEGDLLRIQLANDRNVFFRFSVTGDPTPAGSYITIPVAYTEHVGALANNAEIGFIANMGSGGGSSNGGSVESVVAGDKILVDNTDPQNPIINLDQNASLGGGTWSD